MKGQYMKKIIPLILFSLILSALVSSIGLCENSAPKIAVTCIACHGEKGISANELWPNLAGQKKAYLSKQLLAFKNGDRKDPVMTALVASLSEEDVQVLAAYFSSL